MGKKQPLHASPLKRTKDKRLVAAITAAGAVLIAGGTAGAAVVGDLGGDPSAAANNTGVPAAKTADPEEPAAPADRGDQAKAEEQRDEASEAAYQSFTGATVQSEEQSAPAEEDSSEGDSSGNGSTGEGGSCEASMYSESQPTANGETFDPGAMTAAHKELPFDTMVEVTNPDNGESVTVRINDRGPFIEGRCLDLSRAAFTTIASPDQGVVDVDWQVVG
ncbi:septal ring lytic transglycosylase RlpA family protein [Allosalinactinospora lopnorensis]|uniref:septal ring lytic transglycosylase RlpA family protein n=1 Tax=Allosalinactinospora lopnorensis TaxID=1352348 RepID=UPI0023B7B9FF|nr:septal ring lytic transglycosylase RlpA family protein [Allosalinactinospora lopnorensis]